MRVKTLFASLLCSLICWQTTAGVMFFDDFNSENTGVSAPNYNRFANWTVTSGYVDIIGNGIWDLQPGNGLYVDLDGSASAAGTLQLRSPLNLPAGNYLLSFKLAGHLRPQFGNNTEMVAVDVGGGLVTAGYNLAASSGFSLYSLGFSLVNPQLVNIEFRAFGGDNVGPLLDDVKIESTTNVPDSGSSLLILACSAGLLLAAKRKTGRD
jgi:hypothetical protein